jgi:hypothetical protein
MGYVVFTYTFHLWAKDKKEKGQSVPADAVASNRKLFYFFLITSYFLIGRKTEKPPRHSCAPAASRQ